MILYCKLDFYDLFKKGNFYSCVDRITRVSVKFDNIKFGTWTFQKQKCNAGDGYYNPYLWDYFYTPEEVRKIKLESL